MTQLTEIDEVSEKARLTGVAGGTFTGSDVASVRSLGGCDFPDGTTSDPRARAGLDWRVVRPAGSELADAVVGVAPGEVCRSWE